MSHDHNPPVRLVQIRICQACLDGIGLECHTPGCALFLHHVDLPIHRAMYEVAGPHDRDDCPCGHPFGTTGPCAGCNCADPE